MSDKVKEPGVFLGTQLVVPLRTQADQDAFTANKLSFVKPRWVSDSEVKACSACGILFTQLRRKHHCRSCGNIYCNKCCMEKVTLSYYSYTEMERICAQCKPMFCVISQVQSTSLEKKLEAASALSKMCSNPESLKSLLERGGHHALIHLAKPKDADLRCLVVKSLHSLATHTSIDEVLVQAGAMKAVCRMLIDADTDQTGLLLDSLGVLFLFCKNQSLRSQATSDGALEPVLQLCASNDTTVSLLALQCLCLIAQIPGIHDAIVDNSRSQYLGKLMALATNKDEKVQEVALKTLVQVSCGSDWHRQRIMQEDVFLGNCLARILAQRPENLQVLIHAACLLANLASVEHTQGALRQQLQEACKLMSVEKYRWHTDLMQHVARAVANSAKFEPNAPVVLKYLPSIIESFLQSTHPALRQYAFASVVYMLQYLPQACLEILSRNGAVNFVSCLAEEPTVLQAVQESMRHAQPDTVNMPP